ncbi:MAG: GntR family transcriptional regulator [Flavobacterium sp.]|nr:MAG: GntR family transcriptional regulator [Flavobacterium sp.]
MKVISIQENVGVPKYRQIIRSIEQSVVDGTLGKNDRLPSVNKVCMAFSISRDTVLLAYEILKKRGIVHAIPGKGYYIKSLEISVKEKVFLLFDELNTFKEDIYDALVKGKPMIEKYSKLIMIFPGFREPLGMRTGFENFCRDFTFNNEIIPEFADREIHYGDVYIIPNDRDLVRVIEQSKKQNLSLGSDFGIISYNDTPLKKVVENGITTISTDFSAMGKLLAEMVLSGKKKQVENRCELIVRNSL